MHTHLRIWVFARTYIQVDRHKRLHTYPEGHICKCVWTCGCAVPVYILAHWPVFTCAPVCCWVQPRSLQGAAAGCQSGDVLFHGSPSECQKPGRNKWNKSAWYSDAENTVHFQLPSISYTVTPSSNKVNGSYKSHLAIAISDSTAISSICSRISLSGLSSAEPCNIMQIYTLACTAVRITANNVPAAFLNTILFFFCSR